MMERKTAELEKIIARDHGNMAGLVVLKDGKTAYENYWNGCTAESRVHVYSVTKSILSLLIGIAVDKGYIGDIDQKVWDFFPEYAVKNAEKTIQDITVRNLLTMTAPYRYESGPELYMAYFTSPDRVTFTLDLLGGGGRIGEFLYTPLVGPDLLSGILAKATGQSVPDFAAEHLFTPLGITAPHTVMLESAEEQGAFNESTDISGWVADAAGTHSGGWGLTLSACDMAKIGHLCLEGGMWNGKRILSRKWMEESMKEHSRWEEMDLPYGYLWWIPDDKQKAFAAMGDGGNVIYYNTQKRLVVSITALFQQNVEDRIELIRDHIEPLFE